MLGAALPICVLPLPRRSASPSHWVLDRLVTAALATQGKFGCVVHQLTPDAMRLDVPFPVNDARCFTGVHLCRRAEGSRSLGRRAPTSSVWRTAARSSANTGPRKRVPDTLDSSCMHRRSTALSACGWSFIRS